MRGVDKTAEATQKKYITMAVFCFIFGFFSLFAIAFFPPIGLGSVILFVSGIITLVIGLRAGKLDLEDRRYELCRRLLEVLMRDIGPGYPMWAYVDLNAADMNTKLVRTYERSPWTFKHYRDNWLWIQGDLLDGSVFTVTMAERKRVRSGWKRGYSGKMKYKTKAKSKHEVQVRLAPREKKHPGLGQVAWRGHGAVQLPPYAHPKGLAFKKGELRLKAQMFEWDEPGPNEPPTHTPRASTTIASMLLSLYQMVNLSKTMAKKGRT